MKTSIYLILAGLSSIGLLSLKPATLSYKVDLNQSSISWTASKVTGKHHGTINLKSGELQFEESKLTGGYFEIDMTSITDLDLNGEYNAKLVNHLKSDDFFSVSKFPTSNFKITTIMHQDKDLYKITGDLTIKGITKQISFDGTVKDENGTKIADAFMKINRTDFDIKFRSGSFFENLGDKTIYDDFDLQVKLVTAK